MSHDHCSSHGNHDNHDKPSAFEVRFQARQAMEKIPHKILVMSGKGGVGKTTVAVNLAQSFRNMGFKVGLMDVDIHGPNVPLMCGVEGAEISAVDGKLLPVESPGGLKVMSMSFFLPDPSAAVVWRGPMKIGAIQQFMTDATWDGIEVLVVDSPPGTGDEPLTVAQLLPGLDGAVIVTTPQGVAVLDSRRSVDFARKLNMNILGILENMSSFVCPHCGEELALFSRGGGEEAARELEVPFLGSLPITTGMVAAGDSGEPLVNRSPDDPASQALSRIAARLAEGWK